MRAFGLKSKKKKKKKKKDSFLIGVFYSPKTSDASLLFHHYFDSRLVPGTVLHSAFDSCRRREGPLINGSQWFFSVFGRMTHQY